MGRWNRTASMALMAAAVVAAPARQGVRAQAAPANRYVNFEGVQTSPIRLSEDGQRLFAVNTADARLSIFETVTSTLPRLAAEVPVGLEPVSVGPRSSDEVWVVNQGSDSVSIVSVPRGIVIDTLHVGDEPADVAFFAGRAFVSLSRNSQVKVFDAATRGLLKTIPLFGSNPRALAVDPAAGRVYAAFALAGNRTTIVPAAGAPAPPPPTNPELPPAPRVGLIVDAADPRWSWLIDYKMPDHDVVEIDARALEVVRYFSGVGTTNLGLAVRPLTGEIYVANTEARNRVRFEPNLRGHWVDNRVTRIEPADVKTAYDLNAEVDYSVLPNPAAQAQALAQPTAIAFEPRGDVFYVAAFGSDRVGVVDASGHVLGRIDVRPPATGARAMRGPRGLALHPDTLRLYVLNRLSNTISVVDGASHALLGEVPVGRFDPTPAFMRAGRGFLYDARLSGNGTGSCASCHVDGDMDHIAWDLGDPGGQMQTIRQGSQTFTLHPMKGPMTTQTLRGLKDMAPFHWRGDRADFPAFNGAFHRLMGGAPLSEADMALYTAFIDTVTFMPNPYLNLDGTLPRSLAGGDAAAGLAAFMFEPVRAGVPTTCHTCHTVQNGGTNGELHPQTLQSQPLKVPHLRNVYQKLLFARTPNLPTIGGFGLNHDGMFAGLWEFLSQRAVGRFADDTQTKLDLLAFLLSFDTGTPPAVGFTLTLNVASLGDAAARQAWRLLRQRAAAGDIDLIAKGTVGGRVRGLVYRPASDDFVQDRAAVRPLRSAQLVGLIVGGDTLTFMGVPAGSGVRMGIDRDADGLLDGDDPVLAGTPAPLAGPPTALSAPRTTQAHIGH